MQLWTKEALPAGSTVVTAVGFVRHLGFWVGDTSPIQMWYGVIWHQHNRASGHNKRQSRSGKSRPKGDPDRQLYCLPGGTRETCFRQSRVCDVDASGWSGSSGHSTWVHKIKQTWWTLHVFCKDSWVCIREHKNELFLKCAVWRVWCVMKYRYVILLIVWTKEKVSLKIVKEARKFKIQGKTRL